MFTRAIADVDEGMMVLTSTTASSSENPQAVVGEVTDGSSQTAVVRSGTLQIRCLGFAGHLKQKTLISM